MITFLSAEFLPGTAIRRYQHPTLGVLVVQTLHFGDGRADLIQLHAGMLAARYFGRKRGGGDLLSGGQEAERKGRSRASRKRQARQRPAARV